MKTMNDSDRGRGKKKRGKVRRRGGRETERESGGEQGRHNCQLNEFDVFSSLVEVMPHSEER